MLWIGPKHKALIVGPTIKCIFPLNILPLINLGFVQSENWICVESFRDLFFKKCVSAGGPKEYQPTTGARKKGT